MATTCKNCGPLLPHDIDRMTDFDVPSSTVIEYDACAQCGALACQVRA